MMLRQGRHETRIFPLAFLVVFVWFGVGVKSKCPSKSWKEYDKEKHCLDLLMLEKSWMKARDHCKSLNGTLARIDSIPKLTFLRELINDTSSIWIGACSLSACKSAQEVVRTIDSDTSMWADCLSLRGGRIDIEPCRDNQKFICETDYVVAPPRPLNVCPSKSWEAYSDENICVRTLTSAINTTWSNARDHCERLNGTLARVDSLKKLTFLRGHANHLIEFWLGACTLALCNPIQDMMRSIDTDASYREYCWEFLHNAVGLDGCENKKRVICERKYMSPYDLGILNNDKGFDEHFRRLVMVILFFGIVAVVNVSLATRKKDTRANVEESHPTVKTTPPLSPRCSKSGNDQETAI